LNHEYVRAQVGVQSVNALILEEEIKKNNENLNVNKELLVLA